MSLGVEHDVSVFCFRTIATIRQPALNGAGLHTQDGGTANKVIRFSELG
jgi:hypothetical protein